MWQSLQGGWLGLERLAYTSIFHMAIQHFLFTNRYMNMECFDRENFSSRGIKKVKSGERGRKKYTNLPIFHFFVGFWASEIKYEIFCLHFQDFLARDEVKRAR